MQFTSFFVEISIIKSLSTICKTCPAHEVPALMFIHDRVRVDAVKIDEKSGEVQPCPVDDEAAEYERLINRYGEEPILSAYGPSRRGVLENKLDIVEEMLYDDSPLLREDEERALAQREQERKQRLESISRRKDVSRPRLEDQKELAGFASPKAKKLAERHGMSADDIEGTGTNGLITIQDVRDLVEKAESAAELEAAEEQGDNSELEAPEGWEPDAFTLLVDSGYEADDVEIDGTGEGGLITADDVEAFLQED